MRTAITALVCAVLLAISPAHAGMSLNPSDEYFVPTLFVLIALMVGIIALIDADAYRRASERAARTTTQPKNPQ